MSRLTHFDSPFLLGFDRIERVLDRALRSANDGYPPYNIEKLSPQDLRITIAVAGFSEDDLSVTVEGNQLVIKGKQAQDEAREYLHRGIAARQFQRTFVLADGVEVAGATLDKGLLTIDLRQAVHADVVRKIEITSHERPKEERAAEDRSVAS